MLTWGELTLLEPELAAEGRGLLYQFGVGLAFLSTVRPDGGPRVHPMCPLLTDDGLYAFIVPSPKQRDLHRDARFALHSFPRPDDEDALYVTGSARPVDSETVRADLARQFVVERAQFEVPAPSRDDHLFELGISSVLLTRTTGHGDPAPRHTVWKAPDDGVPT